MYLQVSGGYTYVLACVCVRACVCMRAYVRVWCSPTHPTTSHPRSHPTTNHQPTAPALSPPTLPWMPTLSTTNRPSTNQPPTALALSPPSLPGCPAGRVHHPVDGSAPGRPPPPPPSLPPLLPLPLLPLHPLLPQPPALLAALVPACQPAVPAAHGCCAARHRCMGTGHSTGGGPRGWLVGRKCVWGGQHFFSSDDFLTILNSCHGHLDAQNCLQKRGGRRQTQGISGIFLAIKCPNPYFKQNNKCGILRRLEWRWGVVSYG